MRNNILDEAEKYTTPRTCPNCGHEYPLRTLVKRYIMSYGLSKWACPNCDTLIKCDFIRIQMIWFVGILLTGVLCGVLNAYFDLGLLNIIFVILYFAFALWVLSQAKFERYK